MGGLSGWEADYFGQYTPYFGDEHSVQVGLFAQDTL